jgi:hypothetical protein
MDEIRLMLPEKRSSLPRWELKRDGKVIGWIQEFHMARVTRHFFEAIGIDPENGNHVSLEMSTDFEQRVEVIKDFHEHPERSVHRRSGLRFAPGANHGVG